MQYVWATEMLSMMYEISCFANQASNKSPLKVSNGMNDIFFSKMESS